MPAGSRLLVCSLALASFLASLAATVAQTAEQRPAHRPPWKTSRVHGSPEPPEPYRVVPAFPALHFEKPTSIEEMPGNDRLLITEIGGKIFSFPKVAAASRAELVVDLRQLVPKELAAGRLALFDAEFHPRFRENRYLFVCYVHPGQGGHTRVSRFTLDRASPPRAVPDSELVVLTWPTGGHNAGCLEFGTDGCLYISTGDGSGPNPPDRLTTGQDVSDLLGSILRIDVDHASGERAYTVPSDNPLMHLAGARPEIWAYGLRNPWKFGIDPASGDIFAADNGWETWEMVHRIVRGGNCGWPVMEGRAALRSEVKPGPTPIIPPVSDHPHSEANSVIGGPVYRGSKLPGLAGSFIYGDYITGTIWAVAPDEGHSYSHTTLVDTDLRIVAFAQGGKGELFVLDHDFTGMIYELLPSGLKDTSASFPRRLSQTGLFASLETLKPAAGVVPYAVRVDRWLDGAKAQRWIAIPGDGQIRLSADPHQAAGYPDGTVLVKHLTLEQGRGRSAIRLETQLLHYEHAVWHPYSYLWDDDGRDARLVESIGASRAIEATDAKGLTSQKSGLQRTWHANATNECKLCHNAAAGFVLGFVPNQLNRTTPGGDAAGASSADESQLSRLAAIGVVASAPPVPAASRLVDPHDPSQNRDDRARSYLHANCSMCHHPGGTAIASFYLRRELPFGKLNTNKGTGIGTFGIHDAKIIVPGDPYRSLLLYRMSKLGYARMPYVGSRVVDSAGVALVEEWIRSLPHSAATGLSAPATQDSAEATQLRLLAARRPAGGEAAEGAIAELLKTTEGSLALAAQMHRGALEDRTFQAAASAGAKASSDVRGLFETFVPESKRRATLGAKVDPQVVLSRRGDRQRGKLIFFSDGARCRNCHELLDRSKSLGPTLHEITKKYPRRRDMLEHVLRPSLKIDEPFAAYTLVTDDGRVLSGLLVAQTDREIAIKTVERKVVRIERGEVSELHKSDKSLMPEGVLSDLTAQEAADLLEYIQSQSGP